MLGLILLVTTLITGCGESGGGGGSSSGKVTSYFHIKDNSNNQGLVGVVVYYTDPLGTGITSPATDANGDATIITYKAGTYTVYYAYYNSVYYTLSPSGTFNNTEDDLKVSDWTIKVDVAGHKIVSVNQNY